MFGFLVINSRPGLFFSGFVRPRQRGRFVFVINAPGSYPCLLKVVSNVRAGERRRIWTCPNLSATSVKKGVR